MKGEYVDVANDFEQTDIHLFNPFGDIGHTFGGEIYLDPVLNRFNLDFRVLRDDLREKLRCGKLTRRQFKKLWNRVNAVEWEAIVQTAATLVHEHEHVPQPTLLTKDVAEPPAYNAEERFLRKFIKTVSNPTLRSKAESILNSTITDAMKYRTKP